MKRALISVLAVLALALPSSAAAKPAHVAVRAGAPATISATAAEIGAIVLVAAAAGGFAAHGRRRAVRLATETEQQRPVHQGR